MIIRATNMITIMTIMIVNNDHSDNDNGHDNNNNSNYHDNDNNK